MRAKKLFKILGRLIAIAGLAWVLRLLWTEPKMFSGISTKSFILLFLCISPLFALVSLLLPMAWITLLPREGQRECYLRLFSHYCISQIAKYLPGNVFHFAGRQVSGTWPGLSHAGVLAASFWESLLLIVAAGLLALPMAGQFLAMLPDANLLRLTLVTAAFIIFYHLISKMFQIRPAWRRDAIATPRSIASATTLYLIYFVAVSSLFIVAGYALIPSPWAEMPSHQKFWIYPAVWIAGFIVPGSPGGLGVREAMTIVALRDHIPVAQAGELAIAFRMVTITGDVLVYLIGHALKRRAVNHSAP